MGFFGIIALILLAWVGYSIGNVIAGRKRIILPGILDFILSIILAISAILTRNLWNKWLAILIWLIIGGITGWIIGVARRSRLAEATPNPATEPPAQGIRKIWEACKHFSIRLGDFQGRVLLLWLYYVLITPFGLIIRLSSDPLQIRPPEGNSSWQTKTTDEITIEQARKQF